MGHSLAWGSATDVAESTLILRKRKTSLHGGKESSSSPIYAGRCDTKREHPRDTQSDMTNPFNWPGNLRLVLTPHMTRAINWVGYDTISIHTETQIHAHRIQVSKIGMLDFQGLCTDVVPKNDQNCLHPKICRKTDRASLSRQIVRSLDSRSWWIDKVAL